MSVIKLLLDAMKNCQELTLKYNIIGNQKMAQECRAFEESKAWKIHYTLEEAIAG
jgi:hypothetical protein